MTDEIYAALAALVITAIGALTILVKRWTDSLSRQLSPNGGKSVYDQVTKAMDLSRKALEMSVLVEAQIKEVKTKVDAIILSGLPKG